MQEARASLKQEKPARAGAGRRVIGITVGVLVVLGAGAIVGLYAYNGSHYVSTDNARIAANTAPVTPEIPGRVLSWDVAVGSTVQAGQIIGQLDTTSVAQSSAANVGALSQTAPLTAARALVRAPISGQVIQSTALVGQLVNAGQSLAVIADNSSSYVSANIKEGSIGKVKLGQEARVTLDALPGRTLTGRVQQIGEATAGTFSLLPSGGSDSGNFTKVEQVIPVSIYLTDADRAALIPGSSASVTVDLRDPPATATPVKTVRAAATSLHQQLSVVGTLTSTSSVNVTPQVQGTVTAINVQVGDRVSRGQVIARIDDSNLRAQLAQAQAGLAQARNGVASASSNLQLAASTLDRLKAVYALGGVSRQDLQNAQNQYVAAQAASRNASGAGVEAAQAAVQNLQVTLSKTVIRSPIDGVVSTRTIEAGEVASPAVPILTIVQSDPRKIVATIPANQANLVRTGQAMQVRIDAFPGKTFAAHVTAVNPTSVATGNSFPMEARLDAANPSLRAGMVATADLTADIPAGLPVLPASALTRIGAQNYVYRVVNGKAVRTPVQVGMSGKDSAGQEDTTIMSGVQTGDEVVNSQVSALWDGAPVQAQQ